MLLYRYRSPCVFISPANQQLRPLRATKQASQQQKNADMTLVYLQREVFWHERQRSYSVHISLDILKHIFQSTWSWDLLFFSHGSSKHQHKLRTHGTQRPEIRVASKSGETGVCSTCDGLEREHFREVESLSSPMTELSRLWPPPACSHHRKLSHGSSDTPDRSVHEPVMPLRPLSTSSSLLLYLNSLSTAEGTS